MKLDLFYYTFANGKQAVSIGKMKRQKLYILSLKNGKVTKVTK